MVVAFSVEKKCFTKSSRKTPSFCGFLLACARSKSYW